MLISLRRSLLRYLLMLSASPLSTHGQNIVDTISRDLRFSTLVTLLTAARLTETLKSDQEFTVFAPTNQAFLLSRINGTRLLEPAWSAHLNDLLLYHVSLQDLTSSNLKQGDMVPMANNGVELVRVTTSNDDQLVLNANATVTQRDVDATNGWVQVVDHVLLPVSASQTIYQFAVANPEEYSILAELIEVAELVPLLNGPGPLSMLAPTNEAFDFMQGRGWNNFRKDPQRVRNMLLYHLLDGNAFSEELRRQTETQSLQGSNIDVIVIENLNIGEDSGPDSDEFEIFLNTDTQVTNADKLVKNGIFHTINRALIPPVMNDPTIADLLNQNSLGVFEAAARRTGLWDVLNNPTETLTVFGAVDSGFAPAFTTILDDEAYYLHLRDAMNYQVVVNQALSSEELTPNLALPTQLADESLTVTQGSPQTPVIVDFESLLQTPDFMASNGVLQVVDQVAVPPFMEVGVVDIIARQPFLHSTLVYLLVLTGLLPELASSESSYTIFAPTNAAFEKLIFQSGMLGGTDWTSNIDTMREILKYHVVPNVVYQENLFHEATYRTLQGDAIWAIDAIFQAAMSTEEEGVVAGSEEGAGAVANLEAGELSAGGEPSADAKPSVTTSELAPPEGEILLDNKARILNSDQFGFNGVVHTIDAVLIPTWGNSNYKPPAAPESLGINQYCVQWGQFEEICCPLEPETNVVAKQEGSVPDYCDYIVVPDTDLSTSP